MTGHGGETVVGPAGVDPLIGPCPRIIVSTMEVEHVPRTLSFPVGVAPLAENFVLRGLGPARHLEVETFPCPAPCGPSPDVDNGAEVVGASFRAGFGVRVASGNMGDTFVLGVAFEEFLAVGEEGWVGQGVILENDSRLFLRKHFVETGLYAAGETEIGLGIDGVQVAVPIDVVFYDLAYLSAGRGKVRRLGAVRDQVELPRFRLPYGFEDTAGGFGALVDNESDGYVHN